MRWRDKLYRPPRIDLPSFPLRVIRGGAVIKEKDVEEIIKKDELLAETQRLSAATVAAARKKG